MSARVRTRCGLNPHTARRLRRPAPDGPGWTRPLASAPGHATTNSHCKARPRRARPRRQGHCQGSSGATLDGDQWVSIEMIVNGAESVVHMVNGIEVIRYGNLQLSKGSTSAKQRKALNGKAAPLTLEQGFIALQSESHPIEFRRVAIQDLAQ